MPTDPLIIEFVLAAWIEAQVECVAVGLKVYPWSKAPQRTASKPFCLYHRVDGQRMRSLSGPSGVSHPLIQLDFVGRDYLIVRRIAAAVRSLLEALPVNYSMGDHTVQVAMCDDERDVTDADVQPAHGDETSEFRVMLQFRIWFTEG